MHLNCFQKLIVVSKDSFLILTCLFLVTSLTLAGCSKEDKKAQPQEKKPVVTEMNIPKEPEEPKKDEVESLPLDSEDEDEQLPVLGTGG